jgi:hypothetical protein
MDAVATRHCNKRCCNKALPCCTALLHCHHGKDKCCCCHTHAPARKQRAKACDTQPVHATTAQHARACGASCPSDGEALRQSGSLAVGTYLFRLLRPDRLCCSSPAPVSVSVETGAVGSLLLPRLLSR